MKEHLLMIFNQKGNEVEKKLSKEHLLIPEELFLQY
jgi:hypothetical protein